MIDLVQVKSLVDSIERLINPRSIAGFGSTQAQGVVR